MAVIKGFGEIASKRPGAAVLLILTVVVLWLGYAYLFEYAHADEVEVLKQQVVELQSTVRTLGEQVNGSRLDTISGQLFEAKVKQCAAPESSETRRVYAQRVASLQDSYKSLNKGIEFGLPECNDL